MLSKKNCTSRGWQPAAILPELNLIVFNLLKFMYYLSLLNPLVLDNTIDLCRID